MGGLKYMGSGTKQEGLDVSDDIYQLVPTACDVDLVSTAIGMAHGITENIEFNFTGFYVHGFEQRYNQKQFDLDVFSFMVSLGFRY